MEIRQLTKNIKSDFNKTLSLVGIIPLLVFIYLTIGKAVRASTTEIGYIVVATIAVFVMGIVVGRRMLMAVTFKLLEDNRKIMAMQQELIEKSRLAAITETVLALGDQVNNPLLVIGGNLELLKVEMQGVNVNERIQNGIQTMRSSFQKIREVTDKMSKLTKPETKVIHGDSKMIDLEKSI